MVLLFFVINWHFQKSPAILINLSLSGLITMDHAFVIGLLNELDSKQCNSQSKSLIFIFYSFYGHKIFQVKFLFLFILKNILIIS